MARPKKDKALLLNSFIRIPVTEDQKARIDAAARGAESDTAKWARSVLLTASEKKPGKRRTK